MKTKTIEMGVGGVALNKTCKLFLFLFQHIPSHFRTFPFKNHALDHLWHCWIASNKNKQPIKLWTENGECETWTLTSSTWGRNLLLARQDLTIVGVQDKVADSFTCALMNSDACANGSISCALNHRLEFIISCHTVWRKELKRHARLGIH